MDARINDDFDEERVIDFISEEEDNADNEDVEVEVGMTMDNELDDDSPMVDENVSTSNVETTTSDNANADIKYYDSEDNNQQVQVILENYVTVMKEIQELTLNMI